MSQITEDYIRTSIETANNLDGEQGDFIIGVAGDIENMHVWFSGNKPLMVIGVTRLIEEMCSVLALNGHELTFGQIMSLIVDEHEAGILTDKKPDNTNQSNIFRA